MAPLQQDGYNREVWPVLHGNGQIFQILAQRDRDCLPQACKSVEAVCMCIVLGTCPVSLNPIELTSSLTMEFRWVLTVYLIAQE